MSLRTPSLILALAISSMGCDFLEPDPPDDPLPEPVVTGFDGVLTGTATVAEGLDPAQLRVGLFRTPGTHLAELDNGDLSSAEISLSIKMEDASVTRGIFANEAPGLSHYLLEPELLATVDPNGSHAWTLDLYNTELDSYVVIAWVDEDGDELLAFTPDGAGSEPHRGLSRPRPTVAPDFRLVLEGVWWHTPTWTGNVAGLIGDGTFHEERLTQEIHDGWEIEISG